MRACKSPEGSPVEPPTDREKDVLNLLGQAALYAVEHKLVEPSKG